MYHLLQNTKIQLLIITLLTLLAYSNIFQNQLVLDDNAFIVEWQEGKKLENIPKFFAGNVPSGHQGVYRPVRSILYALYHEIGGDNPFIYHLHSILVHLASTILVYFIVREFIRGPVRRHPQSMSSSFGLLRTAGSHWGAPTPATPHKLTLLPFISSLLFGLHPIHTETITYMASSMESAAIPFALLSFYLYIKSAIRHQLSAIRHQTVKSKKSLKADSSLLFSCLFALLAFFTSEITLSLPLLLLLYNYCFRNWKSNLLPYFLLAGFYVFIRFIVLGIINRAPYLADSVYLTFLTMIKVVADYIGLLLFPLKQAINHVISPGIEAIIYPEYRISAIVSQSFFSLEILIPFAIIITLILIALLLRRKNPLITFSIGWFFLSLLPVSQIVPQAGVMHEKFLYIPSLGFVLLISFLLVKARDYLQQVQSLKFKVKNYSAKLKILNFNLSSVISEGKSLLILHSALLILVSFYFLQTYQRNKDWRDEISIWGKDVQNQPEDNAYAFIGLGAAYQRLNNWGEAVKNYRRALEINPGYVTAYNNIGDVFLETGQKNLAAASYQQARQTGVRNHRIWYKYTFKNLSFTLPSSWDVAEKDIGLYIKSPFGEMDVLIYPDKEPGVALQRGAAQIPYFDSSEIRIFPDRQWWFSLKKDQDVAQLLLFPVDSQRMIMVENIVQNVRFI